MGKKAGNRKHSKIDALDPALRETVEQMLLSGSTYSEIVDFLGANGVGISVASVCRYARAYQAEVQMLNMVAVITAVPFSEVGRVGRRW